MTTKVLSQDDVTKGLEGLSGWVLEGGELVCRKEFAGFPEAMAFVTRVAVLAQGANHHPDIDIRYNKVKLSLISHDAGGLTERDFRLAKEING